MKKILSIILFLSYILQLHAQIQYVDIDEDMEEKAGLIKYGRPITLNLPQVGIGVNLSKDITIQIPVMEGDNIHLNLSDEIDYCWDKEYLNSSITNTFGFAEAGYEKKALFMSVVDIGIWYHDFKEYLKENPSGNFCKYKLKSLSKDSKIKKPIKTKQFGETIAYEYQDITYHFLELGKHILIFYYDSSTPPLVLKTYQKIIQDIQKKNLSDKLNAYELRVKSNFYRKDKHEDIEVISEYDIENKEGTISTSTVFHYTQPNFRITIPTTGDYSIKARKITDKDPNIKEIDTSAGDLYNEKSLGSIFKTPSYTIMLRYITAGYTDMDDTFDDLAKRAIYSRIFETQIDKIPVKILFYGDESDGKLEITFNTDTYIFWGSIYNYNEKTKEDIDQIFASIKINTDENINLNDDNGIKLSSIIPLGKKKQVQLDNITIPQPDTTNIYRLKIEDIGVSFSIGKDINNLYAHIHGEEVNIPKDNVIKDLNLTKNKVLSISNSSTKLDLIICPMDTPTSWDMEELLKDAKLTYSSDQNIKNVRANIIENDSIKWNILTYKMDDQYRGTATIIYKGHNISLNTMGNTIEEVEKNLSYLYTFRFE